MFVNSITFHGTISDSSTSNGDLTLTSKGIYASGSSVEVDIHGTQKIYAFFLFLCVCACVFSLVCSFFVDDCVIF